MTQKTIPSEATQLRASSSDLKVSEKEFSLSPYKAGQVVAHPYWGKFVFEVSSMKMAKDVIPALLDHDTAKGAGKINKMELSETVDFSGAFIDNEHSKYIQDMREVGMECSLRFDPQATTITEVPEGGEITIDGFTHEGPMFAFQDSIIKEVSFTMFGHVPDTVTSFSTAPTIKEESAMADSQPNQAELEQSAKLSFDKKIAQFKTMTDDAQFIMDNAGDSVEEFSAKLLVKQGEAKVASDAKIAELQAKLDEKEVNAVAFSKEEGKTEVKEEVPSEFCEYVSFLQKKEGLSKREASLKAAATQPEMHAQFKNDCPLGGK
jgi:hypothetical protein